ncbi:OadG family protein [Alteromonas sp. CYL-A6]|uniref:OadG family protein n=1 Tax=Alteromonas nitratireducens TaxID=3390813 RepID=UPI0034A88BA5
MSSGAIQSLLAEAATLMLVGMVFVFAFLTLLIFGVSLIARFCARFPGHTPSPASTGQTAAANVEPAIVAAIAAAIHTHRQSNRE